MPERGEFMSEEQYRALCAEMAERYKQESNKLKARYAAENRKYKAGDMITDHTCSGIVKGFRWSNGWNDGLPSAVYVCDRVRKDGKPVKNPETVTIYESSVVSGKEQPK
jgi:hypothetical protein